MLKITLFPDDYFVIGDKTVVQLQRIAGGRTVVAVDAPRDVSILRGALYEEQHGERPACLTPIKAKKTHFVRDQVFPWNDDRERAVDAMERVLDRLEADGQREAAAQLRKELYHIVPQFWESDLTAK